MIEEKYLDQLRGAGLFVSHPMPAFGGGYWVCKPVTTPGNNAPDLSFGFISLEPNPPCPKTDAPLLKFIFQDEQWLVDGVDHAGGMGPGDFVDEWATPGEAIKDIFDFFFGDPSRMNLKAEKRYAAQERAAEFASKKSDQVSD